MIKNKIIEYRNSHPESRLILGTVLGELDRKSKNPTDEVCIQVIKKMIESNIECSQTEENSILELFIPKQLTEDDIKNIILKEQFSTIKDCMVFFKGNHEGCYDGKLVSKLFNAK